MAASASATPSVATAASGKRQATAGFLRASPCFLFLALALAAMAAPSRAAVYKVGGSAGWTMSGDVNYTAWAASKAFRVGDTIVFQYNKRLHSVVEVSKNAYRRCSLQSSLAIHSTGNDSVVLDRAGHRYFFCAVHCALGQKLHVRVLKPRRSAAARAPAPAAFPAPSPSPSSAAAPAPAPAAAPPKSSHRAGRSANASTGATAPAPRRNAAARGPTAWAVVLLAVAAGAALGDLIAC